MKKKTAISTLLACACALFVGAGVGIKQQPAQVSAEETQATANSYGLYVSEDLAGLRGGKTMTLVAREASGKIQADASAGTINTGSTYQSNRTGELKSDTGYDPSNTYGVADGLTTTRMANYGLSEVFYTNYPAPYWRYWEFILTDEIDTSVYDLLTMQIGVQETGNDGTSNDTPIDAWLLAYGSNGTTELTAEPSIFKFGADFFTQGRLDLSATGLKSVSRVAIAIKFVDYAQYYDGAKDFVYFGGWTVHAKQDAAEEVSLTANERGYEYHVGAHMNGVLTAKAHTAYYTNGYKLDGVTTSSKADVGNLVSDEYIYGTERMYAGKYLTVKLARPVKVSKYKYLDMEIKPYAQGADGNWLKEEATLFYFDVLPHNATDSTAAVTTLTANRHSWTTCRIPLEGLADSDGYVSSFILKYASTDLSGERTETVYSIQFASHDMRLTNDETAPISTQLLSEQSKIKGASLTLNDNMLFTYKAEVGSGLTKVYCQIGFEDEETEIRVNGVSDGNGGYTFTYEKVLPQDVSRTLKCTLWATSAIRASDTLRTLDSKTDYSVQDYCETLLRQENTATETKTLLVDFLNYATEAQKIITPDATSWANENLTADEQALATSFKAEGAVDAYAAKGNVFTKVNVLLGSKVQVRFTTNISSDQEATFTVKLGDTVCDASAYTVAAKDGVWTVTLNGLSASQFADVITVTVNGGSAGVQYSVNSYVARVSAACGEGEEPHALVKALYSYGVSAKAYQTK